MAIADVFAYLAPGKDRSHLDNMDGAFRDSLAQMFAAAPLEIQQALRIGSGARSNERQAELWDEAVRKYGSPEAARKWVAPPGMSRHNHGTAADLAFGNDAARAWVHANAANFGLHFPMAHEPWHVEPVGSRGHRDPSATAMATTEQKSPLSPAGVLTAPAFSTTFGGGISPDIAPVALTLPVFRPQTTPAPQQDTEAASPFLDPAFEPRAKKLKQKRLLDLV